MLDEFRQRFCFDRNIFVENFDFALVYINVDFIAGFNLFYVGADFQHRQTDVNRIAIEDAGKAVCYDAFDALNL